MAEWKEKMEEMRREMNWLRDELKRAGEVAEGMGEAMRVMIKCLRISMRIMSGHNVPNADHRFLMENDSALYSKAITMRMEITDPEDLERLSEDEEENNEEPTGVEAPSVSSPDTSPDASGESINTDATVDIVA
jgi:adenine-specific DNA methylase